MLLLQLIIYDIELTVLTLSVASSESTITTNVLKRLAISMLSVIHLPLILKFSLSLELLVSFPKKIFESSKVFCKSDLLSSLLLL